MNLRPDPGAFDFSQHMGAVARHLLGKPTDTKAKELRFGTRGSLSIDLVKGTFMDHESGKGGGVLDLVRREKGLSGNDAIEFLRSIGCGPEPAPRPKGSGKIAATYDYVDEHSALLFQVVRYDPKGFKQRRPNGCGGWDWNVKGVRQVPYFLPELAEALASERTIFICEGEKDTDALAKWGIPATTNAGGAGKWPEELNQHFHGADVVILPHNDPQSARPDGTLLYHPDGRPVFPGQDHAKTVAASLAGVAAKIRILALPGLGPKGDVHDWVENGGTPERLWELVETKAVAPELFHPRDETKPIIPIVKTQKEFLRGFVPPDYTIDGLMKRAFVYSLTGATGSGKSAIALYLSAMATHPRGGQKFGPHEVEQGRIVYIARENPDDIRMRMIGSEAELGWTPNETDYLVIEHQADILNKDLPRLIEEIVRFGDVTLVIVDTSAAVFTGDEENSNTQMGEHARCLRKLCSLPGRPTVLVLCHPIKRPDSQEYLIPRGGGAFVNEMDANFTVWPCEDRKLIEFHWTGKIRGPDFEKITFELKTINTTRLMDSKGRVIPTVMAVPVDADRVEEIEHRAEVDENLVLRAILKNPNGSRADWATACGWAVNADAAKSRVKRIINRLEKLRYLKKEGRDVVITESGKKASMRQIGTTQ